MIIGIPSALGCLVKNKGVALAPAVIMEKVRFICSQTNKHSPLYREIAVHKTNIAETFHAIEKEAASAEKGTIFLGGDHSITYPTVKGIKPGALVIFDAHPDCMHNFSPPSQEDFVNVLIEEGILSPQQIFLVGLRAFFPDEKKFLDQKKIRYYPMEHIFDVGIHNVMDALTEQILPFSQLYVSIDIDCLDPAFAPGVDYPEPGGLNSRELLYAISRLARLRSFSYLDLVEVNPEKDINGQTVWLAAKLIASLL